MTELLVGTKKGLFTLEGAPGAGWEVTSRAFAGEPVEYAVRDGRTGRLLASVSSPFYGHKLWYLDPGDAEWRDLGSDRRGIDCARASASDDAVLACCLQTPSSAKR